jgi:hypothetical protein
MKKEMVLPELYFAHLLLNLKCKEWIFVLFFKKLFLKSLFNVRLVSGKSQYIVQLLTGSWILLFSIDDSKSDIFGLHGKSQCLANPIVPLRLADEKTKIYWVWTVGKTVLVISEDSNKLFFTNVLHIIYPYFSLKIFGLTLGLAKHWDFLL